MSALDLLAELRLNFPESLRRDFSRELALAEEVTAAVQASLAGASLTPLSRRSPALRDDGLPVSSAPTSDGRDLFIETEPYWVRLMSAGTDAEVDGLPDVIRTERFLALTREQFRDELAVREDFAASPRAFKNVTTRNRRVLHVGGDERRSNSRR
jgi:hypothetical protein